MLTRLYYAFKLPEIPVIAAKKLSQERLHADKVMITLLLLQWVIATFLTSLSYGTYLLSFAGGAAIILTVAAAYHWFRGTRTMRAVIATAMMLFSVIYIQQHLGRIEMHFHVFIALALLTLYKEIFPIVVAAAVSIAHHLIFNYLQLYGATLFGTPILVFSYGCGLDIVLLHGAFVILEAMALSYLAKVQVENTIRLVRSEERTRELSQQSKQFANALDESAIVSKADPDGIITYVNAKFCEVSGYDKDELIGKPHSIIRHEEMPASFFTELWTTIKAKKVFKGIIKNRKKSGNAYYVESVIIPILDINGEIAEYLAVRYDVSELVMARDKALTVQKAKDQFLANMSHELRTPLNAIIGFTQQLRKKSQDATHTRYLDIVLESSNKLLYLINDILDIAKIQSGKFTLHPEPFHLNEELRLLAESFKSQAEQKPLLFTCHIDKSLNGTFIGDWKRIGQIVSNFLSNAMKFTPQGGSIIVDALYRDSTLRLGVTDTGIGLTPEAKERIFTPFEQADGSTTRKFGGTGLGLAISRELVSMMHGRIEVESIAGEGSTFTLILPLTQVDPVAAATSTDDTESTRPDLSGRVLVAEDNKSNQLLIRMLLEDMGMECDIANDGREAVQLYDQQRYDLVLMDENMPNMGGIEAMQHIRQTHSDVVPIIALTANVMRGDRERFLEAGMDGFIGKPIDNDALYTLLSGYLLKH